MTAGLKLLGMFVVPQRFVDLAEMTRSTNITNDLLVVWHSIFSLVYVFDINGSGLCVNDVRSMIIYYEIYPHIDSAFSHYVDTQKADTASIDFSIRIVYCKRVNKLVILFSIVLQKRFQKLFYILSTAAAVGLNHGFWVLEIG